MPKIQEREVFFMFILTDGKNYVMENPMQIGQYISTTSPIQRKMIRINVGKDSTNALNVIQSFIRKLRIFKKFW